jgi:ferric-dicitrate binding protein FerR (iron transport regulator)
VENLDEQVSQLLQDDRLIAWVISPTKEIIAYWEQWMRDNPDAIPALFRARGIVHDLVYTERPENAEEMADSIWSGIKSAIDAEPGRIIPIRRRKPAATWLLAASLAGAVIFGTGLFWHRTTSQSSVPEQKVANLLVHQDLDRVNQTDRSQVVYLVDGSKVTLQPGAGIRYAAFLRKDKREVYLKGNAFFDVARDATRPFFVYSGDLVVHVLGTSFSVSTDKNSGEIEVLVKTGKVAVSTKLVANAVAPKPQILTQDQKIIYKKQQTDWTPVVVDSKDLTPEKIPTAKAIDFNFEETPVVSIFKTLENAYGIPMRYDEKTFSNCIVTTSLTDETFEERLKIICAAIGATYRMDEDGVSIDGKPCK